MQEDSEGLNLERILGVLRRRGLLIVLCVVVVAGAAFGFSRKQTKMYTASASIAFNSDSLDQQIAGLPASGPGSSNEQLAKEARNVELVKGGSTAAKTAGLLGHGLTEGKIIGSLSVAGTGESGIISVSARTTSPLRSAEIANTYVQQFIKEQQTASLRHYKSALAIVNTQLAALSPQQRVGPDGVALQNRAQTLSLLVALKTVDVKVASEARPPTAPSSPKTSRNTALGAFLGLLVGLGLAFVLERLDRRIGGPEDLEAIYRVPLLGGIPQSAALSRPARGKGGKRAVLPLAEAEVFSLIRARLRFFNIDRPLSVVVIASAEPGDGKTMVARHLAEAAARLGTRVLLLEADLRHPKIARQLGIQSGPGLGDVLIGATTPGDATQYLDVDAMPGEGARGRTLDVLAAGAVLPPNPGELLESHATDAVLEWARAAYDLVVIDTPPLAAVSDAFPLLTKVDGIIIVGWIGRSHRHAAERLHQVLASSGAPLLGVIANGSRSGGTTPYGYSRDGKPSPAAASVNGASRSEELSPKG